MKKEEKKPIYILCPRCELNYINKKDKYCNVCKAELGLVDPSILLPDDEEAGIERLCPICQVNYLADDEEICVVCQKEKDEREAATKEEDNWDYVEEELPEEPGSEEMEILSLTELEEEEAEEEEESQYKEPDDFDYDVDPDDYLDDEEEEEDEDDDF